MFNRQEALASGEEYYSTGRPCCNGHFAPRNTSTGSCTVCDHESRVRFIQRRKRGFTETMSDLVLEVREDPDMERLARHAYQFGSLTLEEV